MKHYLLDGRILMAQYDDLRSFFETHRIVGRKIANIRPACLDYLWHYIEDWDSAYTSDVGCGIETDGAVCLVFEDGDCCEVEFCGEGPIVLGFNTANWDKYPAYDGTVYALHTMFQRCLGHTITAVEFERSEKRMTFPCYRGLSMSEDDEGVDYIRFVLDDGTHLLMHGVVDWFCVDHCTADGENVCVPMKDLLDELNEKTCRYLLE